MDILRPVMEAELLVLDDLGAEKPSEWVEETMNLIVNTRYNERRPTIFTTNYEDLPDETELDSLKVRVGFRMHSRLHEMCEFLEYDGGDYRMLPANGGADDLRHALEEEPRPPRRCRPARSGQARARNPRRPKELKWPGGKEPRLQVAESRPKALSRCSKSDCRCSASTSTFRSARRSAATAISIAVCSTRDLKTRYVAALEREIRSADPRRAGRAADTIFFGGGTPSLLEPGEVARLIAACRETFDARRPTPRSRSRPIRRPRRPSGSTAFREAGVNRISFGVQSFDDDELRAARPDSLGRARREAVRDGAAPPASPTSAST